MNEVDLSWFDELSAILRIELTKPAERIAKNLLNVAAAPDAEIESLWLEVKFYDRKMQETRPVTEDEWNAIAYREPVLKLVSDLGGSGDVVEHPAPNGEWFTVRDVVHAIEETERGSRSQTEWYGGIDVHHIYFEGLEQEGSKIYICWGS